MDLQANVKQLQVKLKIVNLIRTTTKDTIESGRIDKMKRQRETLETIYKDIDNLKLQVTEQQLVEGETVRYLVWATCACMTTRFSGSTWNKN